MTRRARKHYFPREPGMPAPLAVTVERRVRFSEVDPMGIVWFGRYASFFEEGAAELGRRCGLGYADFLREGLRAPVVQYHTDYLQPLMLDEPFTIRCALIWNDGARLNSEYELIKADGSLAARACTVQVFIGAADGAVRVIGPAMLDRCRARWKAGEFGDLQS